MLGACLVAAAQAATLSGSAELRQQQPELRAVAVAADGHLSAEPQALPMEGLATATATTTGHPVAAEQAAGQAAEPGSAEDGLLSSVLAGPGQVVKLGQDTLAAQDARAPKGALDTADAPAEPAKSAMTLQECMSHCQRFQFAAVAGLGAAFKDVKHPQDCARACQEHFKKPEKAAAPAPSATPMSGMAAFGGMVASSLLRCKALATSLLSLTPRVAPTSLVQDSAAVAAEGLKSHGQKRNLAYASVDQQRALLWDSLSSGMSMTGDSGASRVPALLELQHTWLGPQALPKHLLLLPVFVFGLACLAAQSQAEK